jgi:hypothetical protein
MRGARLGISGGAFARPIDQLAEDRTPTASEAPTNSRCDEAPVHPLYACLRMT